MGTTFTYSENQLVSLLKSHDPRAFAYLYDHYAGALYGIISQILGEQEAANDVLQEVFLNIWRRVETYDAEKGRLYTWMLNIARHAAIDTLRSKSFKNNRKNTAVPENHEQDNALHTPAFDVDNIGLKKMLERLKNEHRVLIELAYFKGYTHEEIAVLEDMPLGTVKTRIRNAIIQLRTYLQ